jgi:hypothetical protein
MSAKQVPEDRPADKWITDKLWDSVTKLERIISGVAESLVTHLEEWKQFLESDKPTLGRQFPNDLDQRLDPLKRIIILRGLFEERLLFDEILDFIRKQLGRSIKSSTLISYFRPFIP